MAQYSEHSDAELVEAVRSGHDEAYKELVGRWMCFALFNLFFFVCLIILCRFVFMIF